MKSISELLVLQITDQVSF